MRAVVTSVLILAVLVVMFKGDFSTDLGHAQPVTEQIMPPIMITIQDNQWHVTDFLGSPLTRELQREVQSFNNIRP